MTHEELDRLWFQAMEDSIRDGEMVVRYHFASLVTEREREECAKVCDVYAANDPENFADICAAAIRARSNP